MIKILEFKLYPNKKSLIKLEELLNVGTRLYNEALAHRIRHHKKNKLSVKYFDQCKILTELRESSVYFKRFPVKFERDALRRVDRSFQGFFRRLREGKKPGFPRYKSGNKKLRSLEYLRVGNYVKDGFVYIPSVGNVSARRTNEIDGIQKSIRIIKRASGWHGQVLIDTQTEPPIKKEIKKSVGIDLGLINFVATSDGEVVKNPKFLKQSEGRLKFLQRKLSKKAKGSSRYKKLSNNIAKLHEKIGNQRRLFCHKISTDLVKNNDLIVMEDLQINNMSKNVRFSKSINDVCWGTLKQQLKYKAENAGTTLILVDPKHTSQTCPECGEIVKKELSERTHNCSCGCNIDRDVAAAKVILNKGKALVVANAISSLRDEDSKISLNEVSSPLNKKDTTSALVCSLKVLQSAQS